MSFYKYENNELLIASKRVLNKNYDLKKEDKDTYELPIDNWYWFDAEDEALDYFNIEIEDDEESIEE